VFAPSEVKWMTTPLESKSQVRLAASSLRRSVTEPFTVSDSRSETSCRTGPVVPLLLTRSETKLLNGFSIAAEAVASAAAAVASAAIDWRPPAESPSLASLSSTALFPASATSASAAARDCCSIPSGPSSSARAAAPARTDWSKPASLPGAPMRASSSVFVESVALAFALAAADCWPAEPDAPAPCCPVACVAVAAAFASALLDCSTAPRSPALPAPTRVLSVSLPASVDDAAASACTC
jgi:hypothetical protein